ncbi:MAG: hypothetical protein WC523_00045 [Patescibacteria group bacterium]
MKKKRKTRVTKALRLQFQEENKIKAKKNKIIPGPWTNLEVKFKITPELRLTKGISYDMYGAYIFDDMWFEKGWYPVYINITSKDIAKEVTEHGKDSFIAAWEKAINTEENKKKYGTIVILEANIDHSVDADETHRFISCKAKTNRKTIPGFTAFRRKKYVLL